MELRNIHNKNNLFHQWTQLSFGNRPLAPKALPQDSFKKSEEDDDTSSKNKKRFATPYSPKSRTRHSPASSVSGTTTAAGNVSIPALFGIATFATVVIGGAVLINKRLQSLQASRLQPEKARRFKTLTARQFEASTTESLLQTESTPKSSKTANDGNSLFSKLVKYIQTLFTKSGTSTASAKNSAQSGNSIPPTPKSSKTANDGNSLWSKLWDAIQTLFAKSGKSTAPAKKPTKTSKSSPPKKTTAKPGSTAPSKLSKMGKAIGSWGKGIWKQVTNPATWPALGRPTGGSGSSAPSTSAPTVGSGSSAASTSAPPGGTIREWFRRLFRLGAGSSAPPHPTPPGAKISSGSTTPDESSISGDDVSGLWFADESVGDDLSCSAFSVGSPTSVDDDSVSLGELVVDEGGEVLSEPFSPVVYPPSWLANVLRQKEELLFQVLGLWTDLNNLIFARIEVPTDLEDAIKALETSLSALNPTEDSDKTDITNKLNGYQTTVDDLKDWVNRLNPSSSGAPDLEEELNLIDPPAHTKTTTLRVEDWPAFVNDIQTQLAIVGKSKDPTIWNDIALGNYAVELYEQGAYDYDAACGYVTQYQERIQQAVKGFTDPLDRSKSQLQQLTDKTASLKKEYQDLIDYVENTPKHTCHFNQSSDASRYKRFLSQLGSAFETLERVASYEEGMRQIASLTKRLNAFRRFLTTGIQKLEKEIGAFNEWIAQRWPSVPAFLKEEIKQKVDAFTKQLEDGEVTHEDITLLKASIEKLIKEGRSGVTPNDSD